MKGSTGWRRDIAAALALVVLFACCEKGGAAEWLHRVPLVDGEGPIIVGDDAVVYFLTFGGHSFEPDPDLARQLGVERLEPVLLAPFQQLAAIGWRFPAALRGHEVPVRRPPVRDAFWDQVLIVSPQVVRDAQPYAMTEAGEFGSALAPEELPQRLSTDQITSQQAGLVDPRIPAALDREIAWNEAAAWAYPLDFQKVLLASRHDASPAFAFQNGQWLTTWLSHDLPQWTKEDHWFAPALLIGRTIVRPAPLSAATRFVTSDTGVTLPMWELRWRYGDCAITQSMYSQRAHVDGPAEVVVRFRLTDLPANARFAVGLGRRPNVHYWDDTSRERTPIPFFTLAPRYRKVKSTVVDAADKVILESTQPFELKPIGPTEMLAVFPAGSTSTFEVITPQSATDMSSRGRRRPPSAARDFESAWSSWLSTGARARLPSDQWQRRIDIWRAQIAAITRVQYDGAERLSYGAYFYQTYFGPEEGWPIVALAQWGQPAEAQRQAEIMLSPENRSKTNVHHQSRNGTAAWYAAEVARLTNDAAWLEKISPALIENAEWTIAARKSTASDPSPLTRGLLPRHIYGGDVREGATSLYAGAACWKGLVETAGVFRTLGSPRLVAKADVYEAEARDFKRRLTEVIRIVANRETTPPFVPLALGVESLQGGNEGPYERLTDSRLGNYWNLFAPSMLQLGLFRRGDPHLPSEWLIGYMSRHGGLWGGLPRFNAGLDAAYAIGYTGELLDWSVRDVRYRNQALAGLQSFFLHAASRNGFTIPEVAGLFPYRLDRRAYEQLVRESPWSFGMYDAERYLGGHISFTEPLGAAAGEALWLIRNALVAETRNDDGLPDGGLMLLSTVPSDWFAEGRQIELHDFPTAYGTISIQVTSRIQSRRRIEMQYRFVPHASTQTLGPFAVRFAPPGETPRDVRFDPQSSGTVRAEF